MKRRVVVALGVLTRLAHAEGDDRDDSDDPAARAKTADQAARAFYTNHDYASAIVEYRRAHDALPDPLFLFDMAQAYRHLHDCTHARDTYRRYLEDRPDADNRERVERFIDEMDACAKPPPSPPPAASTSSNDSIQLAGIATGALGVALIGTGIYFSIQASDQATLLERACAHGCAGADVVDIDRAGHDANRSATLTYVFGGATLAAGAAMFLWATLHAGGEPPVISPTQGGATVSARLRF